MYPEGSFFAGLFNDHPDARIIITKDEVRTLDPECDVPPELQAWLDSIPELM